MKEYYTIDFEKVTDSDDLIRILKAMHLKINPDAEIKEIEDLLIYHK